mmetsp:Transcript_33278/g.79774  ORF Transcript_33278/g.79774 Transcript_33278/m.79774 type:complete len:1220 (+) Transcript_33278:117-3776(+)
MNGTGNVTFQVDDSRDSWVNRWSDEFFDRHWPLLLVMAMEIAVVGGLYIYKVMWVRVQKKRAKNSAVMRLTEEFSLDLLRHFMPSAKVEKYRFRGMAKKKAVASVSFESINLELPSGERILENVSGEFKAGRMCAILGPSGAGKTSLMNVLCGKASYAHVSGSVRFNGVEGNYEDYKTVMGFVPQDDIVHEGLTVGEQIRFSADLRNPREMPASRRKLIYEDVLNVMQLSNIQNSIVGGLERRGISGGQRKRVSIGLELAADPTMLLLDEPTSGLDASSSLSIVHSLKKLTQLGLTSVMVVHQPRWSLFSLFDDVLLLGKGGRVVYQGPAAGARRYFQQLGFESPDSENPADWIMDIIAGEVPNNRIPQFVPEMLYPLWELNQHVVQRTGRGDARMDESLPSDDWQNMMKKLDEEWHLICYRNAPSAVDPKREGVLREGDLLRLLRAIRPSVGDDEEDDDEDDIQQALRQLLARIAGPSALVCTKKEVREFLRGLHGVVAEDKDAASLRVAEDMVKRKSSSSPSVDMILKKTSAGSPSATHKQSTLSKEERKQEETGKIRHPVINEDSAEVHQISPRSPIKVVRREAQHGAPCCGTEEIRPISSVRRIEGAETSEGSPVQAYSTSQAYSATTKPASWNAESRNSRRFTSGSVRASAGDDHDVKDDAARDEPCEVMEERRHYDDVASKWSASSPCSPSDSTLPVVSSLESMSPKHRPKEFKVTLQAGKPHGLTLTTEDGLILKIIEVAEGQTKDWNIANPSLQVKKHDHIVQVNKVNFGADAMRQEMQQEGVLELVIRSRDHQRRPSSKASATPHSMASEMSPVALLGRVGASPKEKSDVASADGDSALGLEVVLEVQHLESSATHDTKAQPRAPRNRSFASIYGNLQRVAQEQQPPGFCRQFRVLMKRSFIQWWRGSWQRAIFLGVITGSSAIMATMDAFVVKEAEWQVLPVLNLHTTLALLIAVFALNLFGTDRPVFWRERESGLSVAAFFTAKVVVNSIDLVLQCFLLTSVYYMIRQPVVSFLVFFPPFLLVTISASGLGYMISTCFPPKHGPFITAIVIFVSCGLLGHPLRVQTMADGAALELVLDLLSITRWTVGYYYLNFLEDTDSSVWSSQEATEAVTGIKSIYTTPSLVPSEMLGVSSAVIFCVCMGLMWHCVAFLRLRFSNRNRGHRRAAPWKQRIYRLQGWLEDVSIRIFGEERQARMFRSGEVLRNPSE